MSMLDFLRDYGKFFSVNYMLSKEIVSSRLEAGISFTEFSYQILQSVDFYHLRKTEGASIQIGGNDQWGNLTSGLELIRKLDGDEAEAEVMTAHLITRADGKKFGKSEKGALFLDRNLTSPYQLYQYFINTTDEDATTSSTATIPTPAHTTISMNTSKTTRKVTSSLIVTPSLPLSRTPLPTLA